MDDVERLFNAIGRRDAAEAGALIAANPALARARNADTLPVLRFARYIDDAQIFEALIAAGPPLDIFEAATIDKEARVKDLLDGDAALAKAYSEDGFTALHFAAYYGSPAVARLLIERGADIHATTRNVLANMPLHAAAAGRNIDICRMLLDAGADVNARQQGGYAPLHAPAQRGDRDLMALLLERGADAGATTDDGQTPADVARAQGNIEIAAELRALASRGQ